MLLRAVAAIALASLIGACGDTLEPEFVPVGLRLDTDTLIVEEGDSVRLAVVLMDSAGNEVTDAPAAWITTDSSVVVVNADGWAVGVAAGEASVLVLAGGFTGSLPVTVPLRLQSIGVAWPVCGVSAAGHVYCVQAAYRVHLPDRTCLDPLAGATNTAVCIMAGAPLMETLAIGGNHACGLERDTGRAYCWGHNWHGRLGVGDTLVGSGTLIPTPVASDTRFVSIGVGDAHTCALSESGTAYCWGANAWLGWPGLFFDWSLQDALAPMPVYPELTFTALAVGGAHQCGITTDGAVHCWGWNHSGQLGCGEACEPGGIHTVVGGLQFVQISAGRQHTCGITSDHRLYCWGRNERSQLGASAPDTCGDGTYPCSLAPLAVAEHLRFQSVSAGEVNPVRSTAVRDDYTCALTTDGEAYCWGAGEEGRLGSGTLDDAPEPQLVQGGLRFATIVARGNTCGIAPDGITYCWGYGFGLTPQRLPHQPDPPEQ